MSAPAARARSDFLGSVVERALERAPAIAPRPLGLFEPLAAAPALAPDIDNAGVQQTYAAPHAPAQPADEPASPSIARSSPPASPIAQHVPAATAIAPTPIDSAIARETVHTATLLRETRLHTIEREPVAPLLVAREAGAAVTDVMGAARARSESGDAVDSTSPAARPREPAPAQADPIAAPLHARLLPERALAAAFAPLHTAERGNAIAQSPSAAAPSITISIGRVEVRAAAPAAPKAPAKSARQPMRLDEYLARKERTR